MDLSLPKRKKPYPQNAAGALVTAGALFSPTELGDPPTAGLPRLRPGPQATWQRQGVNLELLKQSAMHDFGVVLLFGIFCYPLPLCIWFELPPTAGPGQHCCQQRLKQEAHQGCQPTIRTKSMCDEEFPRTEETPTRHFRRVEGQSPPPERIP